MGLKQKIAKEVSPGDSILYDGKFHLVESCYTYGSSIKLTFTDLVYKLTVDPRAELLVWDGN